jgi:hypothetical protein
MSSINLYIGSKLISNHEKNFSTQLSSKNRHEEKYVIHPTELKCNPQYICKANLDISPGLLRKCIVGWLHRRLKESSIRHLTIHFNSILKK